MAQATATADNAAVPGMSRREFLYYVWGASMALFTLQFTGLFIWFAIPRFREGEFGGAFRVSVSELPGVNAPPVNRPDGRFWLVNLDTENPNVRMYPADGDPLPIKGVAAIYKVCTHLGCIYPWNETNERFECPCHGSKYRLDGRRIEAPAPRTLDRFKIIQIDAEDNVLGESEVVQINGTDSYDSIVLDPNTVNLLVDTGARLDGPVQQLICEQLNNCP
jgi:cytochrome b6-f complex iron-sulfur subunit